MAKQGISLFQQDKEQVQNPTRTSHKQNKSSLATVSKTNIGTQLMLLLLHTGLSAEMFWLGGGGGALITFLSFQGGCLLEGECLFEVGGYSNKYSMLEKQNKTKNIQNENSR